MSPTAETPSQSPPQVKAMRCPVLAGMMPVGTALHLLGLGLMVGGMTALGAVTARLVFGHLGRMDGGPLMTEIFRAYDSILLAALGLVLLGEGLRWTSRRLATGKLLVIRWILLGALTASLLYTTLSINPGIQRMNMQGIHPDSSAQGQIFKQQHQLSESLYKLNLLLSTALILLVPFAGKRSQGE